MNRQLRRLSSGLIVLVFSGAPAFAHHLMGGHTPATFSEGILSGLGHPVIGLDHFAAVVAVGCLAAAHRAAYPLVVAFVLAMMAGVAVHLHGATVPGAEILVALSVIARRADVVIGSFRWALRSYCSRWSCCSWLCARQIDLQPSDPRSRICSASR
jgi:hydrogenase/urease accessory protein HupE